MIDVNPKRLRRREEKWNKVISSRICCFNAFSDIPPIIAKYLERISIANDTVEPQN